MIRTLLLFIIIVFPALVHSQGNKDEIQEVIKQIKSADRSPTAEQQAAFAYVFENYAKEPEKTPTPLQEALYVYLNTIANAQDNAERNVGRDAKELPIKIALRHTASRPDILKKLALRKDISLGVRLQATEKLKSDDILTSLGKTLMKSTNASDKYVAAVAFTTSKNYDHEAAQFLVQELVSNKSTRISVLFTDQRQLNRLYEESDTSNQVKLQKFAKSKGIQLNSKSSK